jgi:hypothetical protein
MCVGWAIRCFTMIKMGWVELRLYCALADNWLGHKPLLAPQRTPHDSGRTWDDLPG